MKTFIMSLLLFCGISSALFSMDGMGGGMSGMGQGGGRVHWYTNYQEAVSASKDSSKPMVVLFTGSDWCSACKELEHKVFSSQDFSRQVGNQFIFVMLDYPKGKPQDPSIKSQNDQLKRKFNPPFYPFVIVLDSNENNLGSINGRTTSEFVRELQNKTHQMQNYQKSNY